MHVSAIPQSDLTSNNVFSSCTKKIEAQFHEFIPKLHCTCQQSWDRFKASFFGESRENQFLKTLTKMETIDWDSHKEEIAEILLKASPYGRKGHFLKILLKRCDIENLKGILNLTFEKIFDSSQFNFERILKFLDQKDAASASCSKELMEEIQEIAESLPDIEANKTNKVESEIRKTFKVALNFFPNLMDTMLKAFNLIEAGKGPETMWDFAAMMEIYFKVFMIPHSIFLVVGAVVAVPWQVFLITGVLVLAAVVGVCLYLKYRPCPSKLPRARNLTEEAELGKLEPVIGREKEIHQMGTFLGKKEDGILTNLLLVGEPGVGKTELVKGVAQKYKEKTIFALNAPELASGYTPVGDKLRLLFLDIKGHEDKVVFFIDELGEAIKKNSMANIGGFLKPFLGPDGVQVIAAVTSEEFKEHILTDKPLAERFTKIDVKPTTKEETLSILEGRMENKGTTVRFESKIAEEIYSLTNDLLQPRNSVKLLDLAINRVRAFNIDNYVSEDLCKAQDKLKKLQRAYQVALNHDDQERVIIAKEIKQLKSTIETISSEDKKMQALARKVKRLILIQGKLRNRRIKLAKQNPQNTLLPFLHYFLLPWMETKINQQVKGIKEIPMQVDSLLIHNIHKQ